MRTIRVKGKGKISVKPDMTRLLIDIEEVLPTYDEALEESAKATEQMKDMVEGLLFAREDLKTLSFGVDSEYKGYYDEKDKYQKRFVGYKYTHRMKLEFDSDNKRLGKILFQLGKSKLNPEIRIQTTVKDIEACKNALLGKAVEDSVAKAKVLSAASSVTLGEIQAIDYSWGELNIYSEPISLMGDMEPLLSMKNAIEQASYDIDIEADDIDITDTVTVVWEIK